MTDATTESAHVGPIIFANKNARSQLIEYGEVVTFRGERTTGKTWWTDEYGTKRNGYCTVEQIEAVEPTVSTLERHQPLSGFPSTSAWIDAIDELHDGAETGSLYRVTARDPDA